MLRSLRDRTAVVTGGAQGIGLAMARRFAAAGMNIVVIDRDELALSAAGAELAESGSQIATIRADVASWEEITRAHDETIERFGSVELLLSNAGVSLPTMPLWELDPRSWQWIVDINLNGMMHVVRAFVPAMVEQDTGHVVITASVTGLTSTAGIGGYSTSKHALVGLAHALRSDLQARSSSVGVSLLCPSLVPSNLTESSAKLWPQGVPRPGNLHRPRNLGAKVQPRQASVVADMVHDAVLEDRFWIMTHAEGAGSVLERYRGLQDAFEATESWLTAHGLAAAKT